jgi:hypothetical protein
LSAKRPPKSSNFIPNLPTTVFVEGGVDFSERLFLCVDTPSPGDDPSSDTFKLDIVLKSINSVGEARTKAPRENRARDGNMKAELGYRGTPGESGRARDIEADRGNRVGPGESGWVGEIRTEQGKQGEEAPRRRLVLRPAFRGRPRRPSRSPLANCPAMASYLSPGNKSIHHRLLFQPSAHLIVSEKTWSNVTEFWIARMN